LHSKESLDPIIIGDFGEGFRMENEREFGGGDMNGRRTSDRTNHSKMAAAHL
jgi:hypothetical protein